jgi:hypothetical protein
VFFRATGLLVWLAHRRLFRAGGVPLHTYLLAMNRKRRLLVGRLLPGALWAEKSLLRR